MTDLPAPAPTAGTRRIRRRAWPTKTTLTAAPVRLHGFAESARYPLEGANEQ